MIRARLIGTSVRGAQALRMSGLADVLGGLGFSVEHADAATPPARAAEGGGPELMLAWLAPDHCGELVRCDLGLPPDSLLFAVVPAAAGAGVCGVARGAGVDAVLTAPVDTGSLARALAGCGFVAVSPGECAAVGTVLEALAGGDAGIVRDLVHSLVETNRIDAGRLRAALAAGACADLGNAAHRIKGSARILACGSLVTLCGRLESLAQAGDLATAGALLPILAATLARLEASLSALGPPSRAA